MSGTILNFPNKFAYFCVLYYYPFENFFDILKNAYLRSYGHIEAGNMAIFNIQKMTKTHTSGELSKFSKIDEKCK